MENSFHLSDVDTRAIAAALERSGLAYNDEEEYTPSIVISDDEFWGEILSLIPETQLHDFVINLNFALLDT
jgi:hypothetical protein